MAGLTSPEPAVTRERANLLWGIGANPREASLLAAASKATDPETRLLLEALLIHAGDTACTWCEADVKTIAAIKDTSGLSIERLADALQSAPNGRYASLSSTLSQSPTPILRTTALVIAGPGGAAPSKSIITALCQDSDKGVAVKATQIQAANAKPQLVSTAAASASASVMMCTPVPGTSGQIYFVNPYKFATQSSPTININALASTSPGDSNNAQGVIADGVSTVIAVYRTQGTQPVSFLSYGTQLLKWNANFLNPSQGQALPSGANSVTVSQGDPGWISGNGWNYAVVLLRSLLATSDQMLYSFFINAAQNGAKVGGNLNLYPKPVIFVHGLWSNQQAFSTLAPYLTAKLQGLASHYLPWLFDSNLCYSPYVRFDWDSTKNTVPNVGACTFTSSDAIKQHIARMYGALNTNGIVGGRVDLVVHSMGGLAARNFANPYNMSSQYFNIHNLNQGSFGTIVTIDTPESGSALADFLINHRNDVLTAPSCSTRVGTMCLVPNLAYTLWNLKCSTTDTLQVCLFKNNKPLSALSVPGFDDISTGAPYSLETTAGPVLPGQQNSIANSPAPNSLSGATWRAISAQYLDSSSPESALHYLVDLLIAATQWTTNPIPTVDSILGGLPNDVIVTTQSQTAGSPNANSVPFNQVAHSKSGLPSFLLPSSLSDANVLNKPEVGDMVVCLLLSAGKGTCTTGLATPALTPPVSVPISTSSVASISKGRMSSGTDAATNNMNAPQRPLIRLDETLATVTIPNQELLLGEPNAVTITIHNPSITTVESMQSVRLNGDDNLTEAVEGGDLETTVLKRNDGTSYILITPLHVGGLILDLYAHTPDGALWHTKVPVVVKPSSRKPEELMLAQQGARGENVGVLELPIKGGFIRNVVVPQIRFNDAKFLLDLPASALSFQVRNQGADVIELDTTTGEIKPLREGHALLQATYQGVTNLTCVVVTKESLASPDSSCEDLLQPGEELSLPPGRMKQ
jgi:pimeloyl-ACP methyl ester carboxylesterase